MGAWLTHVSCLVKKAAMANEEDTLGIGGVGGFVDTVGDTKRRRKHRIEWGAGSGSDSEAVGDPLKDEVEERLEEILFGKKPSTVPLPGDMDSEEEEEEEIEVSEGYRS